MTHFNAARLSRDFEARVTRYRKVLKQLSAIYPELDETTRSSKHLAIQKEIVEIWKSMDYRFLLAHPLMAFALAVEMRRLDLAMSRKKKKGIRRP